METQNPDHVCCCLVVQSCLTFLQPHGLGFSREEYWSRLLFPFSRDLQVLPDPGIKLVSSASVSCIASRFFTTEPQVKPRPHKHAHLILDQSKAIQWRKDSLFNKWCRNNWTPKSKQHECQPKPHTLYKNSLKMDQGQNVNKNCETQK